MNKKKDRVGIFTLVSKEPWADTWTEVLNESEIELHKKTIRRNTGLKRVLYRFHPFK